MIFYYICADCKYFFNYFKRVIHTFDSECRILIFGVGCGRILLRINPHCHSREGGNLACHSERSDESLELIL